MARILGLRGKKLRLAVWLEACLDIMIFGYNQASNGSVLGDSSFYTQFPRMNTITTTGHQKKYNSTIQGTVVALYTLLGAFGALGCTFLGDRLGRRMTILLANVLQGLGAILQASAFSFGQFIVGRIIIGLGTGGIVATVSVWQSEVSKAETRGEHVAAFGAFAGMGISLALWVAFGMSFTDPNPVAWRFTLASTLFFSILAGLFIIFLPESPRWLATCLSQPSAETARRLLARAADLLLSTIETRLPYSLSRPLTAISVVAVLTHASIKQSRTTGQCDNNV